MRIPDKFLTRRRDQPRFSALPAHVRKRLTLACQELSEAEQAIAARLNLPHPPHLLMVDEEEGVILTPADRTTIC